MCAVAGIQETPSGAPLAASRGKGAASSSVILRVVCRTFVDKLLGRHLLFLLPDDSHATARPVQRRQCFLLSSVQGLDHPSRCRCFSHPCWAAVARRLLSAVFLQPVCFTRFPTSLR